MKAPVKLPFALPKITEKNKYYALGGILFSIFLLDYFLVMQPQITTLTKLNSGIGVLVKDVKETREDIPKIHMYQADALRLQDEMEVLANKIPPKEELPYVLERISRISNESGVRISQMMPLRDREKMVLSNEDGKYYSLPLLISAHGGYHNIGRFLNKIEVDDIFMSVGDFNIAESSDDQIRHAFRAHINIYILERPGK